MKRFLIKLFLFLFVVIMVPCIFTFYYEAKTENNIYSDLKGAQIVENVNGIQNSMDIETYVKWSAAASIPICYHLEALKAQVIVTRTNTYYKLEKLKKSYPDLIFPASKIELPYINEIELEKRVGKKGLEKYMSTLELAVSSTKGQIIDTNKTIFLLPNANTMAELGESYTIIILHYFLNPKIVFIEH